MKITWLGQAGLLFESDEMTVIVDPYLSNSCEKNDPSTKRRVPIDNKYFDIKPDVLIFTHNHLDHFDPETADKYLSMKGDITVLCPASRSSRDCRHCRERGCGC